jgi:hypothetical protein
MLGILLSTIGEAIPDQQEWEALWRRRQAGLVLTGITKEDNFVTIANDYSRVLEGLIDRFQRVEPVSLRAVDLAAEVVTKMDREFLGMEAWQKVKDLPQRVRDLSQMEAFDEARSCLRKLRIDLRFMKLTLPATEKDYRLVYQFSETTERLSIAQEAIGDHLLRLHVQLVELVRAIQHGN